MGEEEPVLILEEPEFVQPAPSAPPETPPGITPAPAEAHIEPEAPAEEEIFEIAIEEEEEPQAVPPAPEAAVPSEPLDLDLAAERAVLEGRYEEARELLERSLGRDPRNDRVRGDWRTSAS